MILHGDCLEQMKTLADNSVDAIVTDPPYGLSFMGKKWDYDVPSEAIWREALRVLKPGGHVLSFCGTRTYHRMVVRIEDAGFEIRDQIAWLYGQGFPKSQNVALAIDKQAGAMKHRGKAFQTAGAGDRRDIQNTTGEIAMASHQAITDSAKQWQGWGTALKPANEPICLARKPLEKGLTVASNVMKWGTGAINVDASRIGLDGGTARDGKAKVSNDSGWSNMKGHKKKELNQGRWPANVLLDEEAAAVLDEQSGTMRARGNKTAKQHDGDYEATSYKFGNLESGFAGDSVGASRFFYVAKASKRERNAGCEGMATKSQGAYGEFAGDGRGRQTEHQPTANFHPTVKPIKLMEYLITLITPIDGTVLDPFMGSGSTGVAAKNLGRKFIGIERDADYFEIAKKRIGAA
jgi:DNA modification methylase